MSDASDPRPRPKKEGLTHKVLGALARRYARTAPEASAADFVADLLIARPVLQSMSDRKLAQLANALRTESYFATRLVARLPPDKAGQIAVDRFVRFNATSVLEDTAISRLADVLTTDQRFLKASLEKAVAEKLIPDDRASDMAVNHLAQNGSVTRIDDDAIRTLAKALVNDPRFVEAGLDAASAGNLIPKEKAIAIALDRFAARKEAASLDDGDLRALAEALVNDERFLEASLNIALGDGLISHEKAIAVALQAFSSRDEMAGIDESGKRALAEALIADPRFLDISLDIAIEGDLIPKERAIAMALDRFVERGEAANLDEPTVRSLAAALVGEPRFLAAALDTALAEDLIPPRRAMRMAVDQLVKSGPQVDEASVRTLADALATDSRFVDVFLDFALRRDLIPARRAIAMALDRFVSREGITGLDGGAIRALADVLVTDSEFLEASLDVAHQKDLVPGQHALAMALDRLVTRGEVRALDDAAVRSLAEALVGDPRFLDAGLEIAAAKGLMPKLRAAGIAFDRFVKHGDLADLDHASVVQLAETLVSDPRFLEAGLDVAHQRDLVPGQRALTMALDRLVTRGDVRALDDASVRSLAEALVQDPRFLDAGLEIAAAKGLMRKSQAAGIAFDRFVKHGDLADLDQTSVAQLAETLVQDPRFLDAGLEIAAAKGLMPKSRAAGIAFDRFVQHGDLGDLDPASVVRLAETLVQDQRFLEASLNAANQKDLVPGQHALAMTLDRLVARGEVRALDDAAVRSLAEALVGDSRFLDASLEVAAAKGLMPKPRAAGIAFDRFVKHGDLADLDQASVVQMAETLVQDPRFLEAAFAKSIAGGLVPADGLDRMMDAASGAHAARVALDRFISRGAAADLDAASIHELAEALHKDQRFVDASLGVILPRDHAAGLTQALTTDKRFLAATLDVAVNRRPLGSADLTRLADVIAADDGAFKAVLEKAERGGSFASVSTNQGLRIAQLFASRPGFIDSLLDGVPIGDVALTIIRQAASRRLALHLSPEQAVSLACALATPEFALAAVEALRPGDAAELIFDSIERRKLLERLTIGQVDQFAASIAALPFVPDAMVRKLDVTRLNELLFVQTSGASIEALSDEQRHRLGEMLMQRTGATEAFLSGLPRERLLAHFAKDFDLHPPLGQVSTGAAQDFVRSVVSDAGFSPALSATAEALPVVRVREVARVLSSKHQPLVEEQLREATPDVMWRNESYAQEGEDMILSRIYAQRETGFYVDVGALHPIRFSNTYLFYRRGWRGINIDATPGSMEAFDRLRPQDVNIETLVSADRSIHTYYMLNEPALNTMSEELAKQRSKDNPNYRIIGTKKLASRPLSEILDEHVPKGQSIDFLTVDVEGADLEVLQSNDWKRFRPEFVLAELLTTELSGLEGHEITQFLATQGYRPYAKQFNTVFFARTEAAVSAAPAPKRAGPAAVAPEGADKGSGPVRKGAAGRKPAQRTRRRAS